MENLVTETLADQGFTSSIEDEARLLSSLPRNHSEEVVLEKLTNGDGNAVDTEAPGVDVIVDLVHGIESLTKDDARARILGLEEHQEKTFFEIGGVLSATQPVDRGGGARGRSRGGDCGSDRPAIPWSNMGGWPAHLRPPRLPCDLPAVLPFH